MEQPMRRAFLEERRTREGLPQSGLGQLVEAATVAAVGVALKGDLQAGLVLLDPIMDCTTNRFLDSTQHDINCPNISSHLMGSSVVLIQELQQASIPVSLLRDQ